MAELRKQEAKSRLSEYDITEQCIRPSCPPFNLVDGIKQGGAVACPSCDHPLDVKLLDGAAWTVWRPTLYEGKVREVEMPEFRAARQERFMNDHGLDKEAASKLTSSHAIADFFERVSDEAPAATAATFVADTLLGELHYRDMSIDAVEPDECVPIVQAIAENAVTWSAITPIVRTALDEGLRLDDVFEDADIGKADGEELASVIEKVVEEEAEAVEDYRDGKDEALNRLIGAVMEATNGQADAQEVRERLVEAIDS